MAMILLQDRRKRLYEASEDPHPVRPSWRWPSIDRDVSDTIFHGIIRELNERSSNLQIEETLAVHFMELIIKMCPSHP